VEDEEIVEEKDGSRQA